MKKLTLRGLVAGIALALGGGALAADTVSINGAGATFPYPLYSKWFSAYNKQHPEVQINYQSIGSGGGIKQVTERTVDFGATDSPLNEKEAKKAPGLVHIPTVLGGVAVIYNLPSVKELKLGSDALAGIFLGTVRKWNDPAIAQENPGVALPDAGISVAHRSDGSGTTAVFTDYLAKVSPEWKKGPGEGKSVKWPTGLGGKGNEGVTGLVKQSEGSVGYVELAYATQNKLSMAALKNHAGTYVTCSTQSISAAADGAEIPEDFRVSITDAPGKEAYPISAFTYLLVYQDEEHVAKGEALHRFLWWAIHEGQEHAPKLDYAPLPSSLIGRIEAKLKSLTVKGKATLAAQ